MEIKKEISDAFYQNDVAIVAAIIILGVSLILGFYLEPFVHSLLNPVVNELEQQVQSGAIQITFHDIFLNNIRIVFTMYIFGIFACFSSIILAFNGFFTSYYIATVPDFLYSVLLVVPHGIFEFASCILACAASFVLFNFIYKFIKELMTHRYCSAKYTVMYALDESYDKLKQSLILLAVAVVLMIIAGIVEVYCTVPIANYIFQFIA